MPPMSILCCTRRTQRSITSFKSHQARFMGETREKLKRLCTSSPQRLLSLAIRSSEPFMSSCLGEGSVFLSIQRFTSLRICQNSRERIVDLVRDHRGHLADGGHLLDVQHVLMRLLQLARLLFDAFFQGAGPGGNFSLRHLQAVAHLVEGMRQLAHFVMRVNRDLIAQACRWRCARCRSPIRAADCARRSR